MTYQEKLNYEKWAKLYKTNPMLYWKLLLRKVKEQNKVK